MRRQFPTSGLGFWQGYVMLYVNSGSESWRPHSGRGMLLKRHHAIRRRPLGAQTCAHLFQAITILITLRLFANNYIDEAVHRLSPQPSTHHVSPSRYHFISSQPTDTPSKDPIPSLLVKWLTNQDTHVFKRFSSLPCRLMSNRQVSRWPSIPSSCNFRVATPSNLSSPFC